MFKANYGLLLLILWLPFTVIAQSNRTLTGTVKTDSGTAAFGLNVMIKNSSQGTLTNNDGFFSIENISQQKFTLVLMGLGYEKREVEVNFEDEELLHLTSGHLKPFDFQLFRFLFFDIFVI